MHAGRLVRLVVGFGCLVLLPATAWAQAETGSIAGVVRDASGGVVPGVTVEAASPALIEKVRSVVTDDQGLYRIVDLRPGNYTVTFSLTGFNTFRREGIELTTGFNATVNAEMVVGALEETVTVSGAAPVVDIQNVQQQQTLSRETLDAIPTSRRPAQFITLIVGADGGANASTLHDVGGVGSDRAFFGVHGQRADDMTYNFGGMDSRVFSGGGFQYNAHTFEEVVVETAAGSAEATTGGVQINIIPKDGGNIFAGTVGTEITGPNLSFDNVTDELRAAGVTKGGGVKNYYDVGGGIGGPIMRDKLWFFSAFRWEDRALYQAGNYYNKRHGTVFYEPDLSRPAFNHDFSQDASLRLTWQAAPKHKVVGMYTHHPACQCKFALLEQVSPIFAPEAVAEHRYNPQYLTTAHYTYPATNRLLFEVDASRSRYNREQRRTPEVGYNEQISVTDTGLNLRYGSRSTFYQFLDDVRMHERVSVSYVTGTHNFKAGVDLNQFRQGKESYSDPFLVNHATSYTFRNQLPVSVSIYTGPYGPFQEGTENALYVQDQWTMERLTLNLGLRYSAYDMTIPASHLPAGVFVPARDFPEVEHSPRWENLSPRVGAAYDLFGTGRTAIKVALGRYPARNTGVAINLPVSNQPTSTTISWNDANSNFVPDCDLKNPAANGECGAWNDRTFGQVVGGNTTFADDAREGFNQENYNWQGNVSFQHQLRSNMGLTIAYFRTWYGGFQALDNTLVTPADYDPFCITAPVDSRLPSDVSGKQFCNNYDVNPAKFGQVAFLRTQSSHYGEMSEVFDGIDFTIGARFGQGGQVQGGLATGRTVTDNCLVVDNPGGGIGAPGTLAAGTPAGAALAIPAADSRPGFCNVSRPWSSSTQVKFSIVYPLPWDFQVSSIYQNIPGVPIRAQYVATNAEIRPSLGRHLASCPSQTAATCNQTVTLDLIPPFSLYGDRIQQVDLRFTRTFPLGTTRLQGNFDIYNVLNASTILNEQATYRTVNNQWRNPIQIMGGRLLKFSAQLNF